MNGKSCFIDPLRVKRDNIEFHDGSENDYYDLLWGFTLPTVHPVRGVSDTL